MNRLIDQWVFPYTYYVKHCYVYVEVNCIMEPLTLFGTIFFNNNLFSFIDALLTQSSRAPEAEWQQFLHQHLGNESAYLGPQLPHPSYPHAANHTWAIHLHQRSKGTRGQCFLPFVAFFRVRMLSPPLNKNKV